MKIEQEIHNEIRRGNLDKAISLFMEYAQTHQLSDLYNDIILLSGRFHRNENQRARGTHDNREYNLETNRISSALFHYMEQHFGEEQLKEFQDNSYSTSSKSVFLSYSRMDSQVANKIKSSLEENNITVIMDETNLDPSGNIENWILNSIKKADFTLSVISKNSLLSSWVAFETNLSLQAENFTEKRYIPVLIDDILTNRKIVDQIIDELEKELDEIDEIIENRLKGKRGIEDLDNERGRFREAIDNIPKRFRRLKENLSVDIREDQFEIGIGRIISKINS